MTKIEFKRFCKFFLKHPFAKLERQYPVEAGYVLYAVSLFGKYKEDITDYDSMIKNY